MKIFDHVSGDYFTFGDKQIYYEFQGNRQGSLIMFLHGGFGSVEDFKSLTPALADDYCLLGMDSPGHGKSTLGSERLSYALIQESAEALLLHLKLDKVILLGLSDGGIAAYHMAHAGKIHIDKLVTVGSRWHLDDALGSEEIFKKMSATSWKEKFPQTVELYERYNPAPDFENLFKKVVAMWLDKQPTGYLNETLKDLMMPVLIARGDADHLTARKSLAALADLIKNAALFNIPFAGHVAFDEQAEIFRLGLKQFLLKTDWK
ncbi:alpha/beta fold hydrolase [Mucilaginibacter jinjuensis]|uniref:Alpha/beta hydrolase n=1 Tax=Mucilaginibacter jinjuensis TaxID=1176721 RepID=A0ABY7T2T6_9SPHI|nr:alpha/beta hydrolase [Mucilaginibacter jinjuensis]WCT10578.1 alpha/beta hydrolase [Mucilaginibacter jinjuensis]